MIKNKRKKKKGKEVKIVTSKAKKDIEYYRHLLKSSYSDAVKQLKDINGECKDDYYHE